MFRRLWESNVKMYYRGIFLKKWKVVELPLSMSFGGLRR